MNRDAIIHALQARITNLLSIYAFGSRITGSACPVDLLDLRAASTVMQYQIIITGQRWWARDAQAPLFEVAILSEKPHWTWGTT